jgi:hypothetical protein
MSSGRVASISRGMIVSGAKGVKTVVELVQYEGREFWWLGFFPEYSNLVSAGVMGLREDSFRFSVGVLSSQPE